MQEPPQSAVEFSAWLSQSMASASGLGELADLGHRALELAERRARGASESECAEAWILWAGVEWALAATEADANADLAPGSMAAEADCALPADFLSQWQRRAALGVIEALAQPRAHGCRREAQFFCARLMEDLAVWARTLPSANDEGPQSPLASSAQARRLSRVAEKLARRLTGDAFWTLAHAPEPLWSGEEPFSAFARRQTIRFREDEKGVKVFGAANGEGGEAEQEPRSVEDIAEGLLSRFGLRRISMHPFGGARRARREMERCETGFAALIHQAKIPEKSGGLGGLAISVGRPEHLLGGGRAWHRANESAARSVAKKGWALPGEMSFSAPFSDLGHEWTHALDAHAPFWSARQPPGRRRAFDAALGDLREAMRFEEPATAKDAARYVRDIQQETRKMIWNEWVQGELLDFLQRNAEPVVASRASKGLLPPDFARQFQPVWKACKTGSEKTIARAVSQLIENYCPPAAEAPAESKEMGIGDGPRGRGDSSEAADFGDWALFFARNLRESADAERKAKQMMRENASWGPMRWAALLEDRAQWKSLRAPYWATPEELAARGAEAFFAQAGVPELGWIESEGHLQPKGDERDRALNAFARFFDEAKPAFQELAESLREDPARGLEAPRSAPRSLADWRAKNAGIGTEPINAERANHALSLVVAPAKRG